MNNQSAQEIIDSIEAEKINWNNLNKKVEKNIKSEIKAEAGGDNDRGRRS